MFSAGVIDLIDKGCVTNNMKPIHRGKIVSSFLIGTKKLYDFVNKNTAVGKRTSCSAKIREEFL